MYRRALRHPPKPRREPLKRPQFCVCWLIAGPRYHPEVRISRSQHPDGWECAHSNVESGVAVNDLDASDERPHEIFPILETPRFHWA